MALDPAPPIIMAPMGDETCRWAGRHCDGVVFNSLWGPEAVEHSARMVREGAEQGGRDPASVRVWAILVTACEVPEETMLRTIVRRMNTYMYFPFVVDAVGDRHDCARAALARFEVGANGVLFHGSAPADLAPLLECWPEYRPSGLEGRAANPGL